MALPPQYSEGFGGGCSSGTVHAGHVQVHTREDSSNSLEEMFRVVTDPSCSLSSAKPFKDRKLPRSFFDPSPQSVQQVGARPLQLPPPPPPQQQQQQLLGDQCHFRSSSGVVTARHQHRQLLLLPAVSGGGDHQQQHQQHQQSTMPAGVPAVSPVAMETDDNVGDADDDSVLLPGQQTMAAAAAAAAVSHTRAHSSPAKISNQQQQQQQQQKQSLLGQFYQHLPIGDAAKMHNVRESSVDGKPGCPEFEVCALPSGWEMAYNEENKIYFVDHNTKSTSWFDPRIPRQLQSGWGQTASEVSRLHQDYLANCSAHRKLSSLSAQKELLRRQLEAATRNEQLARHEMLSAQGGGNPASDPLLLQCGVEHRRQESSDSGLAPEPVITPPLLEINGPVFDQGDSGDTSVDGLLSSLKETDLLLASDFDMPAFRQDFLQGSI